MAHSGRFAHPAMLAARGALALLAALAAAAALGQGADERLGLSRTLAEQSGLDYQSRQIPGHVTAALEQQRQALPPPAYSALQGAARRAFDSGEIAERVVRAVAQALPAATLREAAVWYASPLGAKITAAEVAASGPAAAAMVPEYAKYLRANPPPKTRLALANQLLDATKAVAYAASVAEAVAVGTTLGLAPLMPPERRRNEADLRRAFRADFAKAERALRETLVVSALYTYGSVSERDLAQYVGFLKSPAGARYQDAALAAVTAEIGRGSIEMGRLSAQTLEAQARRAPR